MSARSALESRRTLLVALVGLLVVAGVAGWLVLRPAAGDGSTTAAPATAAPTTSEHREPGSYGTSVIEPSAAAPTDVPQTVLAAVPGLPEPLSPVALDQPVQQGDGVAARLVDIKAVTAQGHGRGETTGPALVVIVELTKTSGAPVSLDTVAVNMYLGDEGTPAHRLTADSGAPFGGTLAAGDSAQAVYAFSVPTDQRDVVTVTLSHSPNTGTAVFSGSAA
jgi:hypothetical protein